MDRDGLLQWNFECKISPSGVNIEGKTLSLCQVRDWHRYLCQTNHDQIVDRSSCSNYVDTTRQIKAGPGAEAACTDWYRITSCNRAGGTTTNQDGGIVNNQDVATKLSRLLIHETGVTRRVQGVQVLWRSSSSPETRRVIIAGRARTLEWH